MEQSLSSCISGWPEAYLNLLSPFLIQFTEQFGIRWYGLAYLTGFLLGYLGIRYLAERSKISLKAAEVGDFVFSVAMGVVIGGRLGYCLLYNPQLFISFSADFPFWRALAINEGGMASHGGIVGLMVAAWLYARKHNHSWLALLDLTTVGGTLGIFLGRIANFINGELWGRQAPACYQWAVQFPHELVGKLDPRLGESARQFGSNNGVIEAAQHGNPEAIFALRNALPGRYPSQLFESFLEGLIPLLIILWIWRKPRLPGYIAIVFLMIYPIGRILGEQYRMPDAHLGFQALGLTRGQWLSIAMFVGALILLVLWRRRTRTAQPSSLSTTPHGGWMV